MSDCPCGGNCPCFTEKPSPHYQQYSGPDDMAKVARIRQEYDETIRIMSEELAEKDDVIADLEDRIAHLEDELLYGNTDEF